MGVKASRRGNPPPQNCKVVSTATVNRTTVDVLRALFSFAKDNMNAQFPHEPRWRKLRLKEKGEQVFEMSPETQEKVDARLPEGYRDLWRFALALGLRLAECLLRWDQVDMVNGHIRVIQKGGQSHSIPISRELFAILSAQERNHPVTVFTAPGRGGRWGSPQAPPHHLRWHEERLAALRPRANAGGRSLPRQPPYQSYPAVAQDRQSQNGAASLLGHKDVRTTARFYAHVSDQELREYMDTDVKSATPPATPSKMMS